MSMWDENGKPKIPFALWIAPGVIVFTVIVGLILLALGVE